MRSWELGDGRSELEKEKGTNAAIILFGIELLRVSFPKEEQITHREPKQPDRKIERDPGDEREPGVVNGKKAHDRS